MTCDVITMLTWQTNKLKLQTVYNVSWQHQGSDCEWGVSEDEDSGSEEKEEEEEVMKRSHVYLTDVKLNTNSLISPPICLSESKWY